MRTGGVRPERVLACVFVLAAIAYSCLPFSFAVDGTFDRRFQDALYSVEIKGALLHFCGFFLLASVVTLAHRIFIQRRPFPQVAAIVLISAFVLEIGKLLQPARDARLLELLANTVGSLLAIYLLGYSRLRDVIYELSTRTLRGLRFGLLGSLFLGATALWIIVSWKGLDANLESWDETFPLVIASELDESCPWLGDIRFLGIYTNNLARSQVVKLASSVTSRAQFEREDFGFGFDFARQQQPSRALPIGSLAHAGFALPIPTNSCEVTEGFLSIKSPTLLRLPELPNDLIRSIKSSGSFSIEAIIRPQSQTLTGPARIIALSGGPFLRNFGLGQEMSDLVLRVRSRLTGENGTHHVLKSTGVSDHSFQQFVATYDNGRYSIYKAGSQIATMNLRLPGFHLGLGSSSSANIAAVVLFSITISLSIFGLSRFRKWGALMSIVAGCVLVILPPAVVASVINADFEMGFFFWGTLLAAALYPLLIIYVTRDACGIYTSACTC